MSCVVAHGDAIKLIGDLHYNSFYFLAFKGILERLLNGNNESKVMWRIMHSIVIIRINRDKAKIIIMPSKSIHHNFKASIRIGLFVNIVLRQKIRS